MDDLSRLGVPITITCASRTSVPTHRPVVDDPGYGARLAWPVVVAHPAGRP